MQNEYEIKKQICDIGRRIYNRNMVGLGNRRRGGGAACPFRGVRRKVLGN